MHNFSQWLNLKHLGEPAGRAEGLLEAVSFKKATESRKSCECQMEVPDGRGCNTKTTGGKGSVNTRNKQISVGRTQRTCGNYEGSGGKQAEWNTRVQIYSAIRDQG